MKTINIEENSVFDPKSAEKYIKSLFSYKAMYFYRDPMGSIFFNDDGFVEIAYGNDIEALSKYCEENGYKPSIDTNNLDGGYFIKKMED